MEIDPVEASFVRLEEGLTKLSEDHKKTQRHVDTLITDLRSLRVQLEERFVTIEHRLEVLETGT